MDSVHRPGPGGHDFFIPVVTNRLLTLLGLSLRLAGARCVEASPQL